MNLEELFPVSLQRTIPGIGETADDADPILRTKFFYPDFSWSWYPIEYDGGHLFYGYVEGFDNEFGTFSMRELLENRGQLGCTIERDLYFTPCRVSELHNDKGPATSGAPLSTIQPHP